MQVQFPRATCFLVGILAGFAIGYVPALRYVNSFGMRLTGGGVIDTRTMMLRGVIQDVNMASGTLTLLSVSPYAQDESTPFRVTFARALTILSAPPTPGDSSQFLQTSALKKIDATGLIVGSPIAVRIYRTPGTLRANWIVVREPVH